MVLFSLTMGAFVTSTVAFFDISNNLVVNNLAMAFADEGGIKVAFSEDGEYYSDVGSDLLEANTSYDHAKSLLPVTSSFESQWLNSSTVFDETVPRFHLNPVDDSVATKGFIQFPLFVKTKRDGYVYLDDATTVTPNEAANRKAAAKYGVSKAALDTIANCVRVSFYTEEYGYQIYEPNVAKPSDTALAGRLDYSPVDSYYDHELDEASNADREIIYGDYNSSDNPTLFYRPASEEDSKLIGTRSCFNASTKAGVSALDIERSVSEGGLIIAHEKTLTLADLDQPASNEGVGHPLLYCRADEPQRMVLSVYVEGWDLDCIEAVNESSFDMSIVLTATIDQPKTD
jgi:hypothetical protein